MKIDVRAESPPERLALALGLVPTPVFHTLVPVLAARALLVRTKLGVFEALGQDPLTAAEVAAKLGTEREATGKLLNALAGLGYLRAAGEGFALSSGARRWLLPASPQSLRDWVLEQELLEWRWLESLEDFVRTGQNLQTHDGLSGDAWGAYQRGMRSLAGLSAAEVARRVPVPKGARQMLDIGGSHGYYSVALCRRHPGLRSVVLDLPQAISMPPRCSPQKEWATAWYTRPGTPPPMTSEPRHSTWYSSSTPCTTSTYRPTVTWHGGRPGPCAREDSSQSSISSGRARRRTLGRSAPSMTCSSR
jgi:Dimerisation domain/O-methyltransferase domain